MAHSSAPPLKNTGVECLGGGAGLAPHFPQVHQAVRPVDGKWFSAPGEMLTDYQHPKPHMEPQVQF